jgi:hypothetical protein
VACINQEDFRKNILKTEAATIACVICKCKQNKRGMVHASISLLVSSTLCLQWDINFVFVISYQGFNWESWRKPGGWYNFLMGQVDDIARTGVTHVWLPPPSHSVSPQGELINVNYTIYGC